MSRIQSYLESENCRPSDETLWGDSHTHFPTAGRWDERSHVSTAKARSLGDLSSLDAIFEHFAIGTGHSRRLSTSVIASVLSTVSHLAWNKAEDADLKETFESLAAQWERETQNSSSLSAKYKHEAYKTIIKLGDPVMPLIFKRLKTRPEFWFEALRQISKDDPVKPELYGNMYGMMLAWLKWGAKRGYVSAA